MPDGTAGLCFGSKVFRIKRDSGDMLSNPFWGQRAQGWVVGIRAGVCSLAAPVPGADALMHPVVKETQQPPGP